MKTIEEIMTLVEQYSDDSLACVEFGTKTIEEVDASLRAIESALRELVERKPLSDEGIKKHIGVERGSSSFFVLEAIVRATEKAHGIGA